MPFWIQLITDWRCSALTIGPSWLVLSYAGPIFNSFIIVASRPTSLSATASSTTIAGRAMQRSPAQPQAEATMPRAVRSRAASLRTRAWFFASVRACTLLPLAAAVA